jgi:hypothetical protein
LADLEAELFVFPGSRHDDQCDSVSQALLDKNDSFMTLLSPRTGSASSPKQEQQIGGKLSHGRRLFGDLFVKRWRILTFQIVARCGQYFQEIRGEPAVAGNTCAASLYPVDPCWIPTTEAAGPFSLQLRSQPSVRVTATPNHRRPVGKIRVDAELLVPVSSRTCSGRLPAKPAGISSTVTMRQNAMSIWCGRAPRSSSSYARRLPARAL